MNKFISNHNIYKYSQLLIFIDICYTIGDVSYKIYMQSFILFYCLENQ